MNFLFLLTVLSLAFTGCQTHTQKKNLLAEGHAAIVLANYQNTLADAEKLQGAIRVLLNNPTKSNHARAQKAWLNSRESYGQTEAFRFYDGPIDFADEKTGEEGPEGELNAWPVNEAFIDYVQENPHSGLINSQEKMTISFINSVNMKSDEADVTTGYHAIEFLLWGQDLSLKSAGTRTFKDFTAGQKANDRRRQYLKLITEKLVTDLKFLVKEWLPAQKNFRSAFAQLSEEELQSKLFTALATLSAFEIASERMGTSLDSGDQEDEHSCFSDNTHRDFIANQQGIINVYMGTYGSLKAYGLYDSLKCKDTALADEIKNSLEQTAMLLSKIPTPIDKLLVEKKGSAGRQKMEAAIMALVTQAKLMKKAGVVLGVEVNIVAE
jgi:putative iron-regulated protein